MSTPITTADSVELFGILQFGSCNGISSANGCKNTNTLAIKQKTWKKIIISTHLLVLFCVGKNKTKFKMKTSYLKGYF